MKIRIAERDDLATIVSLLTDDILGSAREQTSDMSSYESAFEAIQKAPNSDIYVAEEGGEIVAVAQLDILPCLSHQGATRAQIENVRVTLAKRGQGIGHAFIRALEEKALEKGCRIMQLTSNLTRTKALSFYQTLGYEHTHAGLKKSL